MYKETHQNRANSGRIFDNASAPIMVMSLLSLDASRAGRRNPVSYGASSADRGAFSCLPFSMAAGVGSLTAGRTLSPVSYPASVRHPFAVGSERGGYSPSYGVTAMSQDNTPGDPRPQSLPSLETISNVLATVDAVAALLETALTNPSTITPVWSRGMSATFKNLAAQIDGANLEGLDHE